MNKQRVTMNAERWREIERLYHAALEHASEERETFLIEACRGDQELFDRLHNLLAEDLSSGSLLDVPAWEWAASLLTSNPGVLLRPGVRLGPYQIDTLIAKGGMGQVYKARDTRLQRNVALKVLLDQEAEKSSGRARFEVEARAAAALNHPNIVSLFDFGEVDGYPYAVSELIEGESLRAFLRHGSVPIRKLIDIAAQAADGLAAAHAASIVHRDIKPENIMIASDGRIKILDFGLARTAPTASTALGPTRQTLAVNLTEPGLILGTASYMSPEQARNEVTDYRSDQFSFGLVVYEMATGKSAFKKTSAAETLAAIIRDEPAPIESNVPAPLRWIVDRCLSKEPTQRYDSTRDLYEDLRSLRDHLSEASRSVGLRKTRRGGPDTTRIWKTLAICGALTIALLGIAVSVLLSSRDMVGDLARRRYTPLAVDPHWQAFPVWSTDGRVIAYQAKIQNRAHLLVRYLAAPTATDLGITREFGRPVRWSTDSRRIFFVANAPNSTPQDPNLSLFSISVIGGDPVPLMDSPPNTVAGALSPGVHDAALFCRCVGDKFTVFVSSPLGSHWRPYVPAPFSTSVIHNSADIGYAPNGSKLFLYYTGEKSESETWILPLPPGRQQPYRVLTNLPRESFVTGSSWMPDSRHLVLSLGSTGEPDTHLWMADTTSTDAYQLTSGTISSESWPAVSPDGKIVAFTQFDTNSDVISVSLANNDFRPLIATERNERMAAWALRVPSLAYVTDRNGPMEIWIRSADGSTHAAVTQLNFPRDKTKLLMNPSLSPNGDRMIFVRLGSAPVAQNWIMSVPEGVPQRLNPSGTNDEYGGVWAPDGKRFAYLQQTAGSLALYMTEIGGRETPVLLHNDLNFSLPDWSPTGEWISFQDKSGWALISPNDKAIKRFGNIPSRHLAFSKDGKRLYGVRAEHGRVTLLSLDIATGKTADMRELGGDLEPQSDYFPGIRLSLAPDGQSIAYAVAHLKPSLWLLRGFQPPTLWERLFGSQDSFRSAELR